MLASDYITQLQLLIDQHGDHEMEDTNGELMTVPEFSKEEDLGAAFVGCTEA